MITEKIKWEPNIFGDVIPIESWLECVKDGGFIDYDGHGYLATEKEQSQFIVLPSYVKDGKINRCYKSNGTRYWVNDKDMENFTHINWYNK